MYCPTCGTRGRHDCPACQTATVHAVTVRPASSPSTWPAPPFAGMVNR